jgi:hypothetical protein
MSWNSFDQLDDLERDERLIRSGIINIYWKPPDVSPEEREIRDYIHGLAYNSLLDDHLDNPCTDNNCSYVKCLEKKYAHP